MTSAATAGCEITATCAAGAAGDQVTQSPGALAAVRYGFALVPAVLLTAAFLLQRRYTLDRSRFDVPSG